MCVCVCQWVCVRVSVCSCARVGMGGYDMDWNIQY